MNQRQQKTGRGGRLFPSSCSHFFCIVPLLFVGGWVVLYFVVESQWTNLAIYTGMPGKTNKQSTHVDVFSDIKHAHWMLSFNRSFKSSYSSRNMFIIVPTWAVVVSVLDFYSNDPSRILLKSAIFSVKWYLKMTKINKKRWCWPI